MIYSNLLPDSTLLKSVEEYDSLTIVLCPMCGNLSVGYHKDLPIYQKVLDESTGETKYERVAIFDEANRIKKLLQDTGKQVKMEIYGGPCMTALDAELPGNVNGGDSDAKLVEGCTGSDAVLALCCSVGAIGLRHRLGEEYRIVPGMKTLGISHFSFKFDETRTLVYADKENSTIIPYN